MDRWGERCELKAWKKEKLYLIEFHYRSPQNNGMNLGPSDWGTILVNRDQHQSVQNVGTRPSAVILKVYIIGSLLDE